MNEHTMIYIACDPSITLFAVIGIGLWINHRDRQEAQRHQNSDD